MRNENIYEQGYVLVTALVLLSILTIVGIASSYKGIVQTKVSKLSADNAKALSAANAGLDQLFWYWNNNPNAGDPGYDEMLAMVSDISSGTKGTSTTAPTTPASAPTTPVVMTSPLVRDLYGESLSALDAKAATLGGVADLDAYIAAGNNIRVYEYQYTGSVVTGLTPVNNGNWGQGSVPQVAVWVTGYNPPAIGAYPYGAANVNNGATACPDCALVAYALGRSGETRHLNREYMSTVVTNFQAFGAMVNAPNYRTFDGRCDNNSAAGSFWASDLTAGSGTGSHMIDATQSPGGVAMASNNGVNITNTSKPYPANTGTSLKGIDPWVMYDPGKINNMNYPKIDGNTMSSLSAIVVKQNLQGTADELVYFSSADAQLFNLDAYREAANRIAGFADENIAGTLVSTGGTSLGNYATLKTNNANNARMGTIQWPDFAYNIQNQIPMYGLVRIMIPMNNPSNQTCGASGSVTVQKFSISNDPMPAGRLIVYGGALFDFFWDKNGDNLYQPDPAGANPERLLTPTESLISSKFNVDTHIAFNPVMDGMTPKTTGPTMDSVGVPGILEINTYPVGSPTWDLATDALPGSDGAMDIIPNIWNVGHAWSTAVYGGGSYQFTNFTTAPWLLSTNQNTLLDYYIRTTSNASRATWSDFTVGNIVANPQGFKIQSAADTKNSNSSADLFHAFLPSGYIHGWKRAMAVTGLAADPTAGTSNDNETIWSEDLLPAASQFHDKRHKYFNLTKDHAAGKVYIDQNFSDIPAEMYAGGLVDMHQHSNTSGVVYTPDQLELELKGPGGTKTADAMQYINGIVITGAGVFMKDETGGAGKAIIAYDDTSIDNLPVNNTSFQALRKYLQELK